VLTGLPAGLLTGRLRAILLVPAVAVVGLIQLSTVAALAPSSSLHESSSMKRTIMRHDALARRKKTQPEEDEETAEEDFLSRIFLRILI
jgi:hypothetical protein